MANSVQIEQPVPLFYGEVDPDGVTQPLVAGYDYVITAIILSCNVDDVSDYVVLSDESSVRIMALGVPAGGAGTIANSAWFGEMSIGPRTELQIRSGTYSCNVYIAGYALAPPTTLSV
jgi:hypothetical protein